MKTVIDMSKEAMKLALDLATMHQKVRRVAKAALLEEFSNQITGTVTLVEYECN